MWLCGKDDACTDSLAECAILSNTVGHIDDRLHGY